MTQISKEIAKEKDPIQLKAEELKAKYGIVFYLEVEGKHAWLKEPDRKVLSAVLKAQKTDVVKGAEVLLKNCWIEGDIEIQEDDKYFLGAMSQVEEIIEIKDASIKKF